MLSFRSAAKTLRQFRPQSTVSYPAAWTKLAKKELGGKNPGPWITPEGVAMHPLYINPASTNVDAEEAPMNIKKIEINNKALGKCSKLMLLNPLVLRLTD